MQIREAVAADHAAIRALHLPLFGEEGDAVAALALALLADETARPVLALVAEAEGEVVGSVIFSAVQVTGSEDVPARILAPLAVAGRCQRQGIGRALVEQGLERLRAQGVRLVFVLGDPQYYGRFGFSHRHRVQAPYPPVFPEAWMALALQDEALDAVDGRLQCARSLDRPDLW